MKKIELTQGQYALVDDEDFIELSQHKWYAFYSKKTNSFYAVRTAKTKPNDKREKIQMHRVIMKAKKGEMVDHKNHDTLNNQKENLRLCNCSQNLMNRRRFKNNSSGVIGVSWSKYDKRWRSRIKVNKKQIYLGEFSLLEDAAKARKEAEGKYFKEFALR
jgi:hypothetical protein